MATAIKPAQKPGVEEAEAAPIHRIRITLTSKNVKALEKGEGRGCGGRGVCVCVWGVGMHHAIHASSSLSTSPGTASAVAAACWAAGATVLGVLGEAHAQQNEKCVPLLPLCRAAVCADLIRGAKDKQLKMSIRGFAVNLMPHGSRAGGEVCTCRAAPVLPCLVYPCCNPHAPPPSFPPSLSARQGPRPSPDPVPEDHHPQVPLR